MFTNLVNQYRQPVFEFIFQLIHDQEEAADLCQKVFIKCYSRLKYLGQVRNLRAWIYTIALNQVRDYWRSSKRMVDLDTVDWSAQSVSNPVQDQEKPDVRFDREYLTEMVERGLNTLPPAQKEVIVLKVYHDMTFREIAEVIEASQNTVKSRMYYGLASLKKQFSKWHLEDYIQ